MYFPVGGRTIFRLVLDQHGSGSNQGGQKLHQLLQPERSPHSQELGSELGEFDAIFNTIGIPHRSTFAVQLLQEYGKRKIAGRGISAGKR
jgi:hypothetical protein